MRCEGVWCKGVWCKGVRCEVSEMCCVRGSVNRPIPVYHN